MQNGPTSLTESFGTTFIYRGAGILLRARDTGRFLTLKSAKEQAWGIPGGHVEPGEDFPQAAARELREETSYDGALLNMKSLPMNHVITPKGKLCYQTYYAEVEREFDACLDTRESLGFKWVDGFSNWPEPRQRGIDFLEQAYTAPAARYDALKL